MSSAANPLGLDGFAFVEFCSPHIPNLLQDFQKMGFTLVAQHQSKNINLLRQGQINFIVNAELQSHAGKFAKNHGPSACSMGFRVVDAMDAFQKAIQRGATAYDEGQGLDMPAILGIGGSLIYFVNREQSESFWQHFNFSKGLDDYPAGNGLEYIDHLTHNVHQGEMDKWTKFYETIFNFKEIRYFDIKGVKTGLISRALASPCGSIRIPINEGTDPKSQIEEFIDLFQGEGIQHIALGTANIYETVESMRKSGIKFLDTPDTYYDAVSSRVPWHQENLSRLQKNRILLDGGDEIEQGLLLQIFTENMLGPVFFEIIQRKGNEGFGEGNFQALFEAIERDQMRRGLI